MVILITLLRDLETPVHPPQLRACGVITFLRLYFSADLVTLANKVCGRLPSRETEKATTRLSNVLRGSTFYENMTLMKNVLRYKAPQSTVLSVTAITYTPM